MQTWPISLNCPAFRSAARRGATVAATFTVPLGYGGDKEWASSAGAAKGLHGCFVRQTFSENMDGTEKGKGMCCCNYEVSKEFSCRGKTRLARPQETLPVVSRAASAVTSVVAYQWSCRRGRGWGSPPPCPAQPDGLWLRSRCEECVGQQLQHAPEMHSRIKCASR